MQCNSVIGQHYTHINTLWDMVTAYPLAPSPSIYHSASRGAKVLCEKEWCVRTEVLQWLACMAIPLFFQATHGDEAEDAAQPHYFHTFLTQPMQAWNEEEDACLVALHRQLGPRWPGPAGRLSAQVWAQVQGLVPGRSWQEVRARWDAVLRQGRRKDEVGAGVG